MMFNPPAKKLTCLFSDCENGGEQSDTEGVATCDLCMARWSTETRVVREEAKPRTKVSLTVVTNSEIQAFRDCPQKWGLAYEQGLRPRHTPRALSFGTAVHAGLAAAIRSPIDDAMKHGIAAARSAQTEWFGGLNAEDLTADQLDELAADAASSVALATWMVEHYIETFAEDWKWLVPLGVERAFTLRAVNSRGLRVGHLAYSGVWDLIAYDRRYEDIVQMDHKTTSGNVDTVDRRVELDPQIAGYVWALRRALWHGDKSIGETRLDLGSSSLTAGEVRRIEAREVNTGRVIYNVLRKKRPGMPKVNKDGRVSVAAIDTTGELYAQALREQEQRGFAVSEEQDALLVKLQGRGDAFLSRREFFRTDAEIERWRRELFVDASRVRQAQADPDHRTRNPGHCTMPWSMPCSYRNICLHPDDAEFRAGFVVMPRHTEVEQAREEET